METTIKIFGCIALIIIILDIINAFFIQNKLADNIFDIVIHFCAGALGGLALCLMTGNCHVIDESMKPNQQVNVDNQTCWNINGTKHCGDFTYEDNKSKIEVKNGSTNITVK